MTIPGIPIPKLEELAILINAPVEEGPPDIVPGLLPRRGELVIAGETNIGKSTIALEMCASLINNTPLWGELKPTIQAKRILYILGEHYNGVIQGLWKKLGWSMPDTNPIYLLGPAQLRYDKWVVTQGKINQVAADKLTAWAEGSDLIIFDPLSAFITGIDAENDNVQMRHVLDTMSLVAQRVGAACLVLAHLGKPNIDRNGQEHTRKAYAIRGASAIEDAATNIFYMGRAGGQSAAAQGADSVYELRLRKYKGPAPESYRLLRDPSTNRHTLLGNRPFVEVQRLDTQAKVARLQASCGMSLSEAARAIAAIQGVTERTIWRHLGNEDGLVEPH
jgi:hypothetical protein